MIDDVMYGVILSANMVKFANAPPDMKLKKLRSPPSATKNCFNISLSIPGTGMDVPNLKMANIISVNNILFLRSGIFQAFLKV
jgi:hypothetical protein